MTFKTLVQGSSTFRVRGPIYIFHIILRAAVIADYKIILDILNIIKGAWASHQVTYVNQRKGCTRAEPHSPTLTSLHLRHSSFSTLPPIYLRHSSFYSPSFASPTSQLILQPFRRFTDTTAHSTALPLLHLRHRHFTYVPDTSRTSHA